VNFFRRLGRIFGAPGLLLSVLLMLGGAFVAFIYRGWVDNQISSTAEIWSCNHVRKFANLTFGLRSKLRSWQRFRRSLRWFKPP
jgi:hypothetical protein